MGNDDFDDDYDDIGTLFILDEMDREDERMNRGGAGCLSVMIMIFVIPLAVIHLFTKII